MAYVSPWERLSEAVASVSDATGQSRTEAQADICRAISDGAIKIQGAVGRHSTRPITLNGMVLDGGDFQIPRNLGPTDFDWAASRPVEPWMVRRERSRTPGRWHLNWIELLKADVKIALCKPEVEVNPAQRSKDAKKRRSQPAFDRAQSAITALYPDGVPRQAEAPNANLYQRVGDWLKKNQLPHVSNETILRAAGRRK